jgi:hypothetical protein
MKKVLFATLMCLVLAAPSLEAQDRSRYREFQLGSDLASIVKLIGMASPDIKLVHQRPAVIQHLEWRPRYSSRSSSEQPDPVALIVLRFYNDQLFAVVVDYSRDKTEGMTDMDMVEAISATYGSPSKVTPTAGRVASSYGSPDVPAAIWGDAESSVTLLRVAYPVSFRLIVADTRLDNLARTASAEAVRLDTKEAPQREVARQKKEDEEAVDALKKAQLENKAVFRP